VDSQAKHTNISIDSKIEKPTGNLLWRILLSAFQPPGYGADEQVRGEGHSHLSGHPALECFSLEGGELGALLLAFLHQAGKVVAHPGYEPGTALPAKQRVVEPLMRGEVLEEFDPPLRRVLRIDAPGDFARWPKITGELADDFLENLLQQIILILIVAIERGSIDPSAFSNVSNGNRIKAALGSQFDECLLQQLVRAPDSGSVCP
jgi:hypothetical protein